MVETFRCCKHCADDPVHLVAKDQHEVDCQVCVDERGRLAGGAEELNKVHAYIMDRFPNLEVAPYIDPLTALCDCMDRLVKQQTAVYEALMIMKNDATIPMYIRADVSQILTIDMDLDDDKTGTLDGA